MTFDMRARAERAMRAMGFEPSIPEQIASTATEHCADASIAADLRHLLWSSIDNDDSRDLDQIEYVEELSDGSMRVLVGIADVDACVPKGCPIDDFASEQTTSVYTGVEVFPMLPAVLSFGRTSLLPGEDRLAVVTEMCVSQDGVVREARSYRAHVRNKAKLSYDEVGEWLEGRAGLPESISSVPGLAEQIRAQDRAAGYLIQERQRAGALDFETVEAIPVVADGHVSGLSWHSKNRARYLIENFMISANTSLSGVLSALRSPSIQRIVRKPERWARIVAIARATGDTLPEEPDSAALAAFMVRRRSIAPDRYAELSLAIVKLLGPGEYAVSRSGAPPLEHFGLAVHGYTHSTAPNRRYVDVVIQRLFKAAERGERPPYTLDELDAIADRCNERANAARKVERLMRKVAAAVLLSNRVGDIFDAVVTGASPKGIYVRLLDPPAEGRVTRGEAGLDVGDRLKARLIRTDAENGFIDFANEGEYGVVNHA